MITHLVVLQDCTERFGIDPERNLPDLMCNFGMDIFARLAVAAIILPRSFRTERTAPAASHHQSRIGFAFWGPRFGA
jgi:hypothetical protein